MGKRDQSAPRRSVARALVREVEPGPVGPHAAKPSSRDPDEEETCQGPSDPEKNRDRLRVAPRFGPEIGSRWYEPASIGWVHRPPRRVARFEKSSIRGTIGSTFVAMVKAWIPE